MREDLEERRKLENESIVKIKELVSSLSDKLIDNSELLENQNKRLSIPRKRTIKKTPPPVVR